MASIVYEKLKEIADTNNLTDAQIQNATRQQFASYLGIDAEHINDAVLAVAREKLLRHLDRVKWQAVLDGLKAQLTGGGRVWLADNFPDAEFAVDSRRKTATIFFEGKLSEDEL